MTPSKPDNRPAGRGAGAAALRARIEREGFAGETGASAYRAYMRALRAQAPADLAAIGGRACHQRLRDHLGADGYRERQRAGYTAACRKHGRSAIHRHIARATEERRRWRLAHPTPAEQALRTALEQLGFVVHPLTAAGDAPDFAEPSWREAHTPPLSRYDLVLEARVGPYIVDALLPAVAVAFEVQGGIHRLRAAYDARRHERLRQIGFAVYCYANEEALAEPFAAALAERLQAHGVIPPSPARP